MQTAAEPKGYAFVQLEVHDADAYRQHYMTRSTPAVAQYGGRFLVRGGARSARAGSVPAHHRLVVVEFPSYAQALAFYESPAYAEAMQHRDRYATVHRYDIMEGAPAA
jgi:uncharacterized protein (DUF1330 family)